MSTIETTNTTDFEAQSKKLRRHFKFDEHDLAQNRRGVLSEKQLNRIAGYERGGRIAGISFGAILLATAVGFSQLELLLFKNLSEDSIKDVLVVWIILGILAVLFGLLILLMGVGGMFLIVSQFIKRKPYKLLSIRGRARLVKGHGNRFRRIYYDLYINDQEFDGDSSMNKVITEGAEYIMYYLEGTEEIMSVEMISEVERG